MTVYRIDHPATAAARADAMAAAGLADRGVPIELDLRGGDLVAALGDAGFDPRRPSVFVWEGVSMYLTEAQSGPRWIA